jgi:hypothetical protein
MGDKDWIVRPGVAAEVEQRGADDCGQQNLACPAALARHRELHLGVALDHVGPRKR